MSLFFQSLRSGSSGNCLALWDDRSSILFDCGLKTQRECRDVLARHQRKNGKVDAVLVSHAHGDHMSYAALRVLQKVGIDIHGRDSVITHVCEKHGVDDWDTAPVFRAVPKGLLQLGGFSIGLVEIPHAPRYVNHGFVVKAGGKKIVVFTDFHDATGVCGQFVDADFIYVEANHDRDLLRQNPNPASRYHLSNVKAAELLCETVRRSRKAPSTIMLGHLSHERNRADLAVREVRGRFRSAGLPVDFELLTAPRFQASEVIAID